MTVLRIPDVAAEYLARNYAESGMGYQLFRGPFLQWRERYFFLALNAQYVVPFATLRELRRELAAISEWGLQGLAEQAERIDLTADAALMALALSWELAASLLDPRVETPEALRAMIEPQEIVAQRIVNEPRLYLRFSPFPNDRRVLPDGSFMPGTYATTSNDITMVPSGFAAVGRYALPSTLSAKYVYPIVTAASPIYVGTATPNYGQAGGGVEVLFPNGATPIAGVPYSIPEE